MMMNRSKDFPSGMELQNSDNRRWMGARGAQCSGSSPMRAVVTMLLRRSNDMKRIGRRMFFMVLRDVHLLRSDTQFSV